MLRVAVAPTITSARVYTFLLLGSPIVRRLFTFPEFSGQLRDLVIVQCVYLVLIRSNFRFCGDGGFFLLVISRDREFKSVSRLRHVGRLASFL